MTRRKSCNIRSSLPTDKRVRKERQARYVERIKKDFKYERERRQKRIE
mgnify:CR=1 FL=1